MSQLDRRQALRLLASLGAAGAAGVAAPVLSACNGANLNESNATKKGSVKLGLMVSQAGVYKALGEDVANGFQLYLKQGGGRLAGYETQLVIADEGETDASARAAFDKLVKQEKVLALTGVVNSTTMVAIKDAIETTQIPMVGSNASPVSLEGVKYIWRTSYLNDEPGKALGRHVADKLGTTGTCFLIAADYPAGRDEVAGFLETFKGAGGRVEGTPLYTPFPPKPTDNYGPYLNQIKASDAKAVFCYYAGAAAATFVKQYADAGLAGKIPLYAPGFLTEGTALLKAEGDAASGIVTSLNYSPDLDNPANRRFASEYQKAHGATPTTYAMASYDAAAVLEKALSLVNGELTGQSLNAAIGRVGQVDSPRGAWQFNAKRTPLQKWYLREVRVDGTMLTNSVVSELITLG